MGVNGSLSTLGVPELLQVAALYRKMGSLRFAFESGRVIIVYVQEGNLSGVADSGRVWQLGDLLGRMGKISEKDKKRPFQRSFPCALTDLPAATPSRSPPHRSSCLLYTSDAADDLLCVDLGGRRIIKKKK